MASIDSRSAAVAGTMWNQLSPQREVQGVVLQNTKTGATRAQNARKAVLASSFTTNSNSKINMNRPTNSSNIPRPTLDQKSGLSVGPNAPCAEVAMRLPTAANASRTIEYQARLVIAT